MKQVSTIPMAFIENALEQGITIALTKKYPLDDMGDLKGMYFAGATLCLDVMDKFGDMDVITIVHSSETFGWFSDGTFRRLMSIKGCKLMEELMLLCGIKHETKWLKSDTK